jgi:hypothetical protein
MYTPYEVDRDRRSGDGREKPLNPGSILGGGLCLAVGFVWLLRMMVNTYIQSYYSRFILEGVTEVSQIFLRDTHVLSKLVSYEEHCRRDRW